MNISKIVMLSILLSYGTFAAASNTEKEWIPDEFIDIAKRPYNTTVELYWGQQKLGQQEVGILSQRQFVRFHSPSALVKQLPNLNADKQTKLLGLLSAELASHRELQCFDRKIASCETVLDEVGVIYDESRARLRIFLPADYLTTVQPMDAASYLPGSSQERLSLMQGVELNLSGDSEALSYNLRGETVVAQDERFLNGRWAFYSDANTDPSASIDQLSWNRSKDGIHASLGLHDNSYSDFNATTLFRSLFTPRFYGLGIGTSSKTDVDNNYSATPVDIYFPSDGRVEVYRDGRLLSTQGFPAGNHLLDTEPLPFGAYEIELRVIVGATEASSYGRFFSKTARLPQAGYGDFFLNAGSWVESAQDGSNILPTLSDLGLSAGWGRMVTDHNAIKIGANIGEEFQRAELGLLGIWPFSYDMSLIMEPKRIGNVFNISYSNDGFSAYVNNTRFWKGADDSYTKDNFEKSLYAGVSTQILKNHTLGFRYSNQSYFNLSPGDKFSLQQDTPGTMISRTISYSTLVPLWSSLSMLLTANYEDTQHGDERFYLNAWLNFSPSRQSFVTVGQSMETGKSGSDIYRNNVDASYQFDPNSWSERASVGFHTSTGNTDSTIGLRGSFANQYVQSDINVNRMDGDYSGVSTSYYGSLNSQLASGIEMGSAWGNGRNNKGADISGLLVDLTGIKDAEKYAVLVNGNEYKVRGGQVNLVPLSAYDTYNVRLREASRENRLLHIIGEQNVNFYLYPGNVVQVKYGLEEDHVIFGNLVDEKGLPINIANLLGRSPGHLDESGQFEVRVPINSKVLMVRTDNGYCGAPLLKRNEDGSPYTVMGTLVCRPLTPEQARRHINEIDMGEFGEWFAADFPISDAISKLHQ
ncbi:MAG: TcfC E-set like domain-containing protein [Aeromonas sp.]|uniref:TcfC E-set like domain-containing protein n=1 Tax=Aeromonas sp. TaxID=647 RepID=UPI002FC80A40